MLSPKILKRRRRKHDTNVRYYASHSKNVRKSMFLKEIRRRVTRRPHAKTVREFLTVADVDTIRESQLELATSEDEKKQIDAYFGRLREHVASIWARDPTKK